MEEVATDISYAFRNHGIRKYSCDAQIYKFLIDESKLATRFRFHPSYLHLPFVYKFGQEEEDLQSCDVYLTFSDTPSSNPKQSVRPFLFVFLCFSNVF